MNLLDIRTKEWSSACVEALTDISLDLVTKLGPPVNPGTIQGHISPYFVERFGFSPECKILSFTGDNPSSFAGENTANKVTTPQIENHSLQFAIVVPYIFWIEKFLLITGMCLGSNDIAVSLGTSDTVFLSLTALPDQGFTEGHILVNPISPHEHMALLCFKNGSLTRERIKKSIAEGSWDLFNELLDSTPRGNFGNIGFYFDLQEILPKVKAGDHRFNREGTRLLRFSSLEIEIRAVIEGQFLAKRIYAQRIGCKIRKVSKYDLKITQKWENYVIKNVIFNFNSRSQTRTREF